MDEEDFDRTLRIEIPPAVFTKDTTGDPEWTSGTPNGWSTMPGSLICFWQGSIDLSGYARQSKTFYPHGGFLQEGSSWSSFNGSGQQIITCVTSVPMDSNEALIALISLSPPGMLALGSPGLDYANINYEQVMFSETQINLINANLPAVGICQPITKQQQGSFSATAADKLFVIKLVVPLDVGGNTGTTLGIPASRVVLPGRMGSEPELEYMMRLSRSVQLANQV